MRQSHFLTVEIYVFIQELPIIFQVETKKRPTTVGVHLLIKGWRVMVPMPDTSWLLVVAQQA
jgi:hypothetical protein